MTNSPVDLDQEFAKIVDLNVRKHEPIPKFLRGEQMTNQSESARILTGAANLAANEDYALYGDQVKFNLAVSQLVNWMSENRAVSIKEATFSELVQFARQFTKVIKGTVHNSQSYMEAASSLGKAAECAAKEDKQ